MVVMIYIYNTMVGGEFDLGHSQSSREPRKAEKGRTTRGRYDTAGGKEKEMEGNNERKKKETRVVVQSERSTSGGWNG